MADNTTFGTGNNATPPPGLVVSLEEITNLNGSTIATGEKAQRVIPALRTADGVVADLPGNATDGIMVNLGPNNDVTVTGTVTANAGATFPVSVRRQSDSAEMGIAAAAPLAVRFSDGTSFGTPGTDYTHDAALTVASTAGPVLVARASETAPAAVTADNDAVILWADRLGRLVTISGNPTSSNPVSVNPTASGNTTVIAAPGAGLSLYVRKGSVHNSGSANVTVQLQDGAAGATGWAAELAAEGGGSLFDFGERGWKLTANTLLNANLSGAGDVRVNITDYYVSA